MTCRRLIVLAATLVAVSPASVAVADTSSPSGGNAQTTPTTPAGETTPPTTPPVGKPPAKPTVRTRITALPGSTITDATAPLRVRLSAVPAPGSPVPMLSPGVAGKWTTVEDYESFTPKSTLEPCSTYTLTVWAGTTATGRLPLGKRRTLTLHVACPGLQALQQGLSRLGYLPYTLHSRHNANSRGGSELRSLAAHYAYHPPAGPLVANVPHAPGLWYGALDPTTRGALMVFQSSHGLSVTGVPDRSTWASLLAAETLGHGDPAPYTFVTVLERV